MEESRTPFYQIRMEGEDITPWVTSVTVVEDDRQTDNITLAIPDPRMIYADALFEGSTVEADLGYAGDGQHALLLRAIITKVELSYPENGLPMLTLKGEDKSIMMGLVEKKRLWRDRKVTDIVRELGRKHGFQKVEASLSPDPKLRQPVNQDGKTDLAFLQELAQEHHAKCFVELDEQNVEVLYFIPERRIVKLNRPDALVLRYRSGPGSNLIGFSPSFDSNIIDRLKEVEDIDHRGNKIKSQEKPPSEVVIWKLDGRRQAQASAADWEKITKLYEKGAEGKRKLQKQLAARRAVAGQVARDQAELELTNDALESRRLGMKADGTTFGNIWLRAKSNVHVQGVGARFDGEWYVSNVTHRIDAGGYKTDFKCVR
jgi:phage protein D